ncbi:Parvalbumin [Trema orientale]|uniref:Parvalbumin n=1 Tax=Trema orientale TaxID=63057 RepID=A0A2P5E7I3_TREOI|nr:Parvalbumin [Trema orientale]
MDHLRKKRKSASNRDAYEALKESSYVIAKVIEKASIRLSKAIGEDMNDKHMQLGDELKRTTTLTTMECHNSPDDHARQYYGLASRLGDLGYLAFWSYCCWVWLIEKIIGPVVEIKIFNKFDSNVDGEISSDELRGMLLAFGSKTSSDEVKHIMAEIKRFRYSGFIANKWLMRNLITARSI